MKILKREPVVTEVVEDVICDCCGKSCKTEYGIEMMELKASWGFMSNKYLETWEAHLCEQCVDEKLSFVRFKRDRY